MVKVSSGRKGIEYLFGEDVGIVCILRRKDNLAFFGSDGKFCGKGGLSDVFVIK